MGTRWPSLTVADPVSSSEAAFIKEFSQTFGMTYNTEHLRRFSIVVDPMRLDTWNKYLAIWIEDGSAVCSDAT